MSGYVEIDRERLKDIVERESATLNERTPASSKLYDEAKETLALGVSSTYQVHHPWPIYFSHGKGSRAWDIDGNEYVDFHNGFGSMIQGHAHPAISKAVKERVELGTHFAAPVEDAVIVSQELARRWDLPRWRYVNSGSEATMDAIRIARAYTGRDHIVKIFGSYHGHHDYVMVDVSELNEVISDPEGLGPRDNYRSLPYGAGIPQAVVDMTHAVPFNDAGAMERRIDRMISEGIKPACVIMEAAMMNCGVILPEPGYLEAVREITATREIVLIFDEVKTGLCIAAGGATERFNVKPDMVTLAKALGGGLPAGAIGGSKEVFSVVEDESVWQVGTYNGSPLVMAAARASLQEVLTPEAYEHVESVNRRILDGCSAVIEKHNFPGYTVGLGSKGQITMGSGRIVDYESFLANQDGDLTDLGWLWRMNRGILTPPGRDQEYTLSVVHSNEDADRYIEVFEELAAELTD